MEPAPHDVNTDNPGLPPADVEPDGRQEPMHPGDPVPSSLLRLHVWFLERVSSKVRLAVGIAVGLLAIVLVTTIAAADVLGIVLDDLGLVAYAGLFLASWLGNGGHSYPSPACGSSRS